MQRRSLSAGGHSPLGPLPVKPIAGRWSINNKIRKKKHSINHPTFYFDLFHFCGCKWRVFVCRRFVSADNEMKRKMNPFRWEFQSGTLIIGLGTLDSTFRINFIRFLWLADFILNLIGIKPLPELHGVVRDFGCLEPFKLEFRILDLIFRFSILDSTLSANWVVLKWLADFISNLNGIKRMSE